MPSTFTIYRSSDASAPALSGAAGSLLTLLDAVLVNGYGSKAAAGWTKPFANSGNIGCYKQGAGALMGMVVNDNGPNVTSTFKEAWMTGWETVLGVTGPVGTGTGEFPLLIQSLTTGHVVCRKSTTADGTARTWIIVADSTTFYLFVLTGDVANTYLCASFGDFFSLNTTTDLYRCVIIGRAAENDATAATERLDVLSTLAGAVTGHFVARQSGGTGTSITVGKHGDAIKGSATALLGTVQFPNAPDTGLYISPVWVCENTTSTVRGRMRGFYQQLHAVSNFTDGQTFTGVGDYAGKTFILFKSSGNAGCYFIETSATVETN